MNGATAKLWREPQQKLAMTLVVLAIFFGCSPTSNRNKGSDTDRKSDITDIARL